MSQIVSSLEKGFEKYYNTLINVGYINRNHINSIIIGSWINDVLEGKYGFLVSDKQYELLNNLYNCIEGDCLIPYQNYCKEFTLNKVENNPYIRTTETISYSTNRTRHLEDNNIRTL